MFSNIARFNEKYATLWLWRLIKTADRNNCTHLEQLYVNYGFYSEWLISQWFTLAYISIFDRLEVKVVSSSSALLIPTSASAQAF